MAESTSRATPDQTLQPGSGMRMKTVEVDQEKLDRLMTLLKADTEADVLDRALELLLFQEEACAGVRTLSGRGHQIENIYDPHLNL